MHRQRQAIGDIDQAKLGELLQQTSHKHLVLTSKEDSIVQELVDVLHPFAEATDLTQGDQVVTLSAVVPTVLCLRRFLLDIQRSVRCHGATVNELLHQLHERFYYLFERFGVAVRPAATGRSLAFDTDGFLMASSLDPKYAFHWLQDHPGSQDEKDALRIGLLVSNMMMTVLHTIPTVVVCLQSASNSLLASNFPVILVSIQ